MQSNSNKYKNFRQIVNLFYNEELEDLDNNKQENTELNNNIKIEPKLIFDKIDKTIKLEIFIGNTTMYKIKKMSEFYDRMTAKECYKYGDKLEFIHKKEAFAKEYLPLLQFVLKYAEIINYGNSNSNPNYRFGVTALSESQIILNKEAIDSLFEILKNQKVKVEIDREVKEIKVEEAEPNIKFILNQNKEKEYILLPNVDIYKLKIINGNKFNYLLIDNSLYKCSEQFEKTTMKLLNVFMQNYLTQVKLEEKQLPQLFSIIVPKIQNNIEIKINQEEIKKYFPKELTCRLYLDFDKNNYLIANLSFVYDKIEYNPLEDKIKNEELRDIIKETKALNILRKTGFMLDNQNLRFVLTDEDKIYEFITKDFEEYIKIFDILATDNFKAQKIKQPQITSLGVKIENNLLEINLKELNIDINDIISIMSRYNLKKKYYRLKDGTFLNLENDNIEFLNRLITGADLEYKELETGLIRLPIHRALYLEKILEFLPEVTIEKNDKYNQLIKELDKNENIKKGDIPSNLENVLRNYQKIGVKWLKELDKYHFGGILADDMGLGKTIQLLSVVSAYVEEEKNKGIKPKTSIVVSPSSLVLNWQNEANKFATELKILIISGSAFERKKQIQSIDKYDLVITSYDLLKRDIEYYNEKNYHFKYVIADEAQYLKNSSTQNAIAIKFLQAETRYALTGTPMENSLAELWSIFDFIMPGYLFSYTKFKNMYEAPIIRDKDIKAMKKLKMLIEPFVLRRNKKEVLTELPEKTITVLTSNMQEEQKRIYMSYLAEVKEEIQEAIEIEGLEKNNMRILAILTRLRQICCHPSVFIENYEGGSSKLEQCLELVKSGIESGHKILIFSGYTSIFPIIENELEEKNIKYSKLTGATKVNERIDIVNEFNKNDEIKVFLISLKAGGTGLNLTSADMVIHYDPWWNASAENQATDRAYRIGQKNNVQVYKLITKDSIEEKIYELQQKKSALIDNMLDINTSFINKLSREDILSLFREM